MFRPRPGKSQERPVLPLVDLAGLIHHPRRPLGTGADALARSPHERPRVRLHLVDGVIGAHDPDATLCADIECTSVLTDESIVDPTVDFVCCVDDPGRAGSIHANCDTRSRPTIPATPVPSVDAIV